MHRDGTRLALSRGMSELASTWKFAKRMYDSLRNTPHEPTARAYLEATARLVLAKYSNDQRLRIAA